MSLINAIAMWFESFEDLFSEKARMDIEKRRLELRRKHEAIMDKHRRLMEAYRLDISKIPTNRVSKNREGYITQEIATPVEGDSH